VSFVRFGEGGSDVYVYHDVRGYVTCCFCPANPDPEGQDDFHTTELEEMLGHLEEHRRAGQHVPAWVDADMRGRWPDFGEAS
jgi:hypothetical protein